MFDTDFTYGAGMVKYAIPNKLNLSNLYETAQKLQPRIP